MTDISVNVTNKAAPINGLANAPQITIRRNDTGAVAAGPSAMTDRTADGLYTFNFTPISGIDYSFLIDADPTATKQVTKQERYYNGIVFDQSQRVRDAMKLAPTAGVPAAGSVDEHLDDILADTAAMQPTIATNLDATVSSRNSVVPMAAATSQAEHDATQLAIAANLTAIGALNDLSIADVQTALTNQGYTVARAPNLDNLDATVSSRATVAAILSAALGSGDTVDQALSRLDNIDADVATNIPALIAALNDLSIADVQTALTNQGYTAARAPNLDNLDATVSSRATQTSVDTIDANVDDLVAAVIADELIAAAGSTTTEIRTNATQANDFYNDMVVVVVNAAGVVARQVTDYAQTNGAFTVSTLPFTPAATDPVYVLNAVSLATGAGLTQQQVRDAMKLAPTAGAPAVDSVDEKLDNIETDTSTMQPLVSTNLDAQVSTRATQAQILSDATPFPGANIDAAISSRSTLTQAQILSDATPFPGANIDATISSRATVAGILAAALTSGDTVDQALSRLDNIDADVATNIPALIAALNDLSIADVQTALTNQGYTAARAPNLDNLDATVSSRATQTSVDTIDAIVDDILAAMVAAELAAVAGSTTTEVRTGASQATGFYDDMILVVINSAGVAARRINSYNQTNGAFTVDALPFTPAATDPVYVVARVGAAAGGTITQQQVRDAMKLAPTAGAPATDSIDDKLDDLETQVGALNDISVADILAASLGSGDSVDQALSRLDNIDADVATNIPAAIAALNDLSIADVQTALTNQGYTGARAVNLDNLDATISSRNSVTPMAAATSQTEHDATQAAIAALNDLAQSDILTDATPFPGANIDATISSRASQTSVNTIDGKVDVIDANVDDLKAAIIAAELTTAAGSSSTVVRTNATQANDFYNDMILVVINSAGVAARSITDYAQTNGAFTVDALPFTPITNDPIFVINTVAAAGGGAGLTQQQVRDAMKLTPTVGAPSADSVDEHLDDILADTAVIEPLVSTNLDATVSSRATPADVTGSETNILNAIALLNDLSIADVQTALTNQGYTIARAGALDNLDATVSSRATVLGILSAVLASGDSVDVALSRLDNIDVDVATTIPALITALNDISIADVQTAMTNQGYTPGRATNLDNLDATISSVLTAIGALNDISVSDILTAVLGSGNTVDAELSGILALRDFIEGGRDIDFTGNDALGWQRIERDIAGTLVRRYNLFDETGSRINETVGSFIGRAGMISAEVAI